MPKPGYTAITVSLSLKQRLKDAARSLGYRSVPALIEDLLNRYQYPYQYQHNGGHPQPPQPPQQTGLISSRFSRNKGGNLGTVGSGLAGPPGFEPGTLGLGGRCPILARPRAHIKI